MILCGFIYTKDERPQRTIRGSTDHCHRPVVAGPDVVKVASLLEGRNIPIQLPHPQVDSRIPVPDCSQVTLEVDIVYGVEADLQLARYEGRAD